MQKISNFDELKSSASSFKSPKAGAYVCKIVSVKDIPESYRLAMTFDIAEGEFAGYYQNLFNEKGFWGLDGIASYTERSQRFFAKFINAVEQSNLGYHWDFNENSLVGKKVGIVCYEREYINKKGNVGVSLKEAEYIPAEDVISGNYTVPPRVEVSKPAASTQLEEIIDDGGELPF